MSGAVFDLAFGGFVLVLLILIGVTCTVIEVWSRRQVRGAEARRFGLSRAEVCHTERDAWR